jgi:hypothetical protein
MSEQIMFQEALNEQGMSAALVRTENIYYQFRIGEQTFTPDEASKLLTFLKKYEDVLSIAIVHNDKKDRDNLYDEEQRYYQVEYDLNFHGGDYRGMSSQYAYISCTLADRYGMERAFQMKTKHDPVHIIGWSESETFTAEEALRG